RYPTTAQTLAHITPTAIFPHRTPPPDLLAAAATSRSNLSPPPPDPSAAAPSSPSFRPPSLPSPPPPDGHGAPLPHPRSDPAPPTASIRQRRWRRTVRFYWAATRRRPAHHAPNHLCGSTGRRPDGVRRAAHPSASNADQAAAESTTPTQPQPEEQEDGMSSGTGNVVCVTGASVYIVSWLVKFLLQCGYTIRATVRYTSTPTPRKHCTCRPWMEPRTLLIFSAPPNLL
uniref:NmrA-like domain-containing protein n=2 Tax=Aegilops tauschii subsp. strangulata TaxID=200361 RepID=A0A453C5R1_AEGTS